MNNDAEKERYSRNSESREKEKEIDEEKDRE